jgi:hypothetical protein
MLIALYTITIFVGAFLLFLVQPMAAKVILPVLGGSPSVWNTCMLFFQVALLAGYGYAHGLARLRRARMWAGVHGVVVLLPLLILGRAIPADPGEPPVGQGWEGPIPWLLMLLATTVGPFFFVLATTGPLIQRWFSATDHPSAKDPYFLYAASNAGSLLALLAYPVLVEPALALGSQERVFTAGYMVYAALVLGCGAVLIRRSPAVVAVEPSAEERITGRQRLLWIGLAFVPSSLMLGVTQFLSTDLAAVPLLWIMPLSLYLLSFILAFAKRQVIPLRVASVLLPMAVMGVLATMMAMAKSPLPALVGLHLAALFLAALVCHRRLALARPGAAGLTQYYLLIALGGALGGVFNALVAPMIFNDILEYPIALVLSCLMIPAGTFAIARARVYDSMEAARLARLVAAAAVILPAGIVGLGIQFLDLIGSKTHLLIWVTVPMVACGVLLLWPRRFALALTLLLVVGWLRPDPFGTVLFADRTFFGTVQVYVNGKETWFSLFHGTTRHGVQANHPEYRLEPTLYYHRGSPIGDYMSSRESDPGFDRCALVGLGVGALAGYAHAGQEFTFYEIDPVVAAVAQATELFHYIEDARERGAVIPIVMGDARLKLRDAPEGGYDLIVLDAFSSDAIPVHLLTIEAITLYLSRLAPDGVLAFHVSNRYLELRPVLAAAARDLGLVAVTRTDAPTKEQRDKGAVTSVWMMLARSDEALKGLKNKEGWLRWSLGPGERAWTDDYSNVLGAFGVKR